MQLMQRAGGFSRALSRFLRQQNALYRCAVRLSTGLVMHPNFIARLGVFEVQPGEAPAQGGHVVAFSKKVRPDPRLTRHTDLFA